MKCVLSLLTLSDWVLTSVIVNFRIFRQNINISGTVQQIFVIFVVNMCDNFLSHLITRYSQYIISVLRQSCFEKTKT